jgi:5'-3' exonuclease
MGIRGLYICIKKTVPDLVNTVDWKKWSNCRIGIDIQCFMYRAISRGESPLKNIAAQIDFFRSHNINIIYIFDGKPPIEKYSTSNKRYIERKNALQKCDELRNLLKNECDSEKYKLILNEIRDLESQFPTLTQKIKDEIKHFLNVTGTLFICAKCEADTLLAYWFRRNIIDAVVSYDYDFIARGCTLLIPKQGSTDLWTQWEEFNATTIRKGLYLSEIHFRELCVLMGSDYTMGLPIVPWKSALTSLQKNMSMDTIWSRHTFSNWREINIHDRLIREINILDKAKRILGGEDDMPEHMMENDELEKWYFRTQNSESFYHTV